MIEGSSQASILNAESKIQADERGFRTWMSVSDISNNYLGSVICVKRDRELSEKVKRFMSAWRKANDWLFRASLPQYVQAFNKVAPTLGSESYFHLLHDPVHGLTKDNELDVEALQTLIILRKESDAYVPKMDYLADLISKKYN